MTKLEKYLTIIIITIITVLVAFTAKTNANGTDLDEVKTNSLKTQVNIKRLDLTQRDDLFCIQHGKGVAKTETAYTISGHLTIDGNKIGDVKDEANGTLAYILKKGMENSGYGNTYGRNYGKGQIALYHYYDTWYNAIKDTTYSNQILTPSDENKKVTLTADAKTIIDNGKEYAKNIGNLTSSDSGKIEDKTDKNQIKLTHYISHNNDEAYLRVGPFKWDFEGSITNVDVYSDKNSVISNVAYSKFIGTQEIFILNTDITSDEMFYITLKVSEIDYNKIVKITPTVKSDVGEIYKVDIWFLNHKDKQKFILTDVETENPETISKDFKYDIKLTKDLEIVKVDASNKKIKLEGVGFLIQNKSTGKYVRRKNGVITYVDKDDKNNPPTEFITDEDGKIEIKGLAIGTYIAYETKNPNYGYKKIDGGIEIAASKSKEVISNTQVFVKLSGYIWKDINSSKMTIRNDLYKTDGTPENYIDDQDEGFNGITVRLKYIDKDGNPQTVKKENGKLQETVSAELDLYSEIDGGEYIFKDVLIEELENCYVEFEYDGLIYQSVEEINLKKNSGSKATDEVERKILDKNFASIDATGENKVSVRNAYNEEKYTIIYEDTKDYKTSIEDSSACKLHANTSDTGYKIKDQFTAGTEEIKYVNLGLYERPKADLSLTQDLENVKVGVNGYWHVYNYAQRTFGSSAYDENNPDTWNVGVKFKNSFTGTYKRAIYESDVNYRTDKTDENGNTKELQVYLTYKIALSNESSYLTKVNKIVDYFDSRYTLVAAGTGLDATTKDIVGNVNCQAEEVYNTDYKKSVIEVNSTVASGESNYIYVQFKLDREAVLNIINNKETLYNKAEITSYTVLKDDENTVAAVDRDSVPGNVNIMDINTYEDDTDSAPSVQLELKGARAIEGTVFVDSTTGELKTGEIRQGDGKYTEGENLISGVTVTLHELNNSIPDMTMTTGENGEYSFTGYIPGQYTITYTWGDKTYTVQNYKGTVYDSNREQNNMYWYKDDVATRKTDAIDDYNTRIEIDKEIASNTNNSIYEEMEKAYNGEESSITYTKMNSTTPTMEFSVEYDTVETNGTGDKVEFIVKNVDFGIVERARQQLDMAKRVSKFKITLANGQVLADATVTEDGKLEGLHDHITYMGPSVSNGYSDNGFIKAEIDSELIEGATLELTYEIKFINNSEKDYMSEEYYKYGIQKGNVVTLTPAAVVDYLDNNLAFEAKNNSDWKQITEEDLKALNAIKVKENLAEEEKEANKQFLNSRTILYTEKTKTALEPTGTVSVDLNVSKLLTTSNDLNFSNDAETVTIERPEVGSIVKTFPTDDAEEVQITPSTGEDRAYIIPTIIGITSLLVLGIGIFGIKKFIIGRK